LNKRISNLNTALFGNLKRRKKKVGISKYRKKFLKRMIVETEMYIQGVSEIRMLILTSEKTHQFIKIFSLTFLRKSITN
jgi:hypothetical protein